MKTSVKKDRRIPEILAQLRRFSECDFTRYLSISEQVDEIDAICAGLNVLLETLAVRGRVAQNKEERINQLFAVILRYALMDFSEKADISVAGDEIDALAAGLNAIGEEFAHLQRRLKDREEDIRLLNTTLEHRVNPYQETNR